MTWQQLVLTLPFGWTRGMNIIGCKSSSTWKKLNTIKHCRPLLKNTDCIFSVTKHSNPLLMLTLQRNKKSNSRAAWPMNPKCLTAHTKTEICGYRPLIHWNFFNLKTRSLLKSSMLQWQNRKQTAHICLSEEKVFKHDYWPYSMYHPQNILDFVTLRWWRSWLIVLSTQALGTDCWGRIYKFKIYSMYIY